MPSRKIHNLISRIILGEDYDDISEIIDLEAKKYGKYHRRYGHDLKSAAALSFIARDPKVFTAAILHITTDKISSELKRKRKEK